MAKNRIIKHLECSDCGIRNYNFRKSGKKKAIPTGKLVLSKFCSKCKSYKEHKETK